MVVPILAVVVLLLGLLVFGLPTGRWQEIGKWLIVLGVAALLLHSGGQISVVRF